MWKANGKTTTLSFFLGGLFPKTEISYMRDFYYINQQWENRKTSFKNKNIYEGWRPPQMDEVQRKPKTKIFWETPL
jgi:hypothetical protein